MYNATAYRPTLAMLAKAQTPLLRLLVDLLDDKSYNMLYNIMTL